MELFCKASVSNGLTGWNHYMFSQGRNPKRLGHSGDTFYWFCPLTAEGERTSAFPLVKRMSNVVKTSENIIVNAKRRAEVCVLFYPPYYANELERPVDAKCELQFIASAIRRPAYFDGLLKVLQVLNIDYDLADLTRATADILNKYKQVWAFTTDEMNARDQQTMVDYVKTGGNLVIFPSLPDREMSQRPCTIIRDAIEVSPSGKETIDSPLIDIFEFQDIKCANPQITFSEESLAGAEVIARTIRGTACGFSKLLGKGTVSHLGTWIGFEAERHKEVYEAMLKRSGAKLRQASAGSDRLVVRERFTDDHSTLLFIGNYYNEEQTGKVTYTHPGTGEPVTIPYGRGEMVWPALYGVLTPVCLDVAEGLKLLHCTSDILGVTAMNDQLDITVYGDRDLAGEIVFEGDQVHRVRSVTAAGEDAEIMRDNKRIAIRYPHKHKEEIILCVKM
jgi:beta-galactosidase